MQVLSSGLQCRIDRRAIKVWMIGASIETAVLGLFVGGVGAFLHFKLAWPWAVWVWGPAALVVVLFGVLKVGVLPALSWQSWRYEINDRQIDLQRGVWFIKRTLIPMVRVQHVDTQQGVLMRRYGLASVNIWTASGEHEIPALPTEAADALRNQIAQSARLSADVV